MASAVEGGLCDCPPPPSHSYELTGGEIARVLCSAAEQVAMDTSGSTQITQEQLAKAAEEEVSRRQLSSSYALSIFN